MLSKEEAEKIVGKNMPNSHIVKQIEHGNYYIYMILVPAGHETAFAPFFYVHKKTGEFRDFNIMDFPEMRKIEEKFLSE